MKKPDNPPPPLPRSRPPLERMMRLHQFIASGSLPTATTLAAELEVATKTIQRDLEFMRDRLNLPLSYDVGRHGWFYTEEVTAFPTLQITEGELFALLVAEKALQQYRGTNFEKPLLSAFKKMEASLPDTISLNLADWDKTISFRTSAEPLLNLEIFDALAKATAGHHQLELKYRKPGSGGPELRVVDPYHLANINGEWFLFAFDHLRKDIRTFVPARISAAHRTGQKFTRPQSFSVDKRLRDSFGVHSADGQFEVVVQFDSPAADYVREKRWHASQELRELKGGGVELRLKISSLGEVQRWLLGFGGHARVLKPAELAASIRAAAAAIVARGG